jgi:regulatory protein
MLDLPEKILTFSPLNLYTQYSIMAFRPKKKNFTPGQALPKIQFYCATRERCQAEVRDKLREWGVYGDDLDQIMVSLIEGNYVNELRYAKAFTSDKYRLDNCGRQRIVRELKQKEISDYCIQKALDEIHEGDYRDILLKLLQKKSGLLPSMHPAELRQRLFRYALQRGYEADLIEKTLADILA